MILPLHELQRQLEPLGIEPLYPNSGRFDFARGLAVERRCFLVEPDSTIRADLQPSCRQFESALDIAQAAAGHLAQRGIAPLYLVPHVHWEHELLDHAPALWRELLTLLGVDPADPALTGANALVLQPGATPLALLIHRLLENLAVADVLLLCPWPLIVKVHHHKQLWWSSTDPMLLPEEKKVSG